jgi:hypothetical protein
MGRLAMLQFDTSSFLHLQGKKLKRFADYEPS